jgi:hypothetical protein
MKRFLAFIIIAVTLLSLLACNYDDGKTKETIEASTEKITATEINDKTNIPEGITKESEDAKIKREMEIIHELAGLISEDGKGKINIGDDANKICAVLKENEIPYSGDEYRIIVSNSAAFGAVFFTKHGLFQIHETPKGLKGRDSIKKMFAIYGKNKMTTDGAGHSGYTYNLGNGIYLMIVCSSEDTEIGGIMRMGVKKYAYNYNMAELP